MVWGINYLSCEAVFQSSSSHDVCDYVIVWLYLDQDTAG